MKKKWDLDAENELKKLVKWFEEIGYLEDCPHNGQPKLPSKKRTIRVATKIVSFPIQSSCSA